jgi:hypothetical protein
VNTTQKDAFARTGEAVQVDEIRRNALRALFVLFEGTRRHFSHDLPRWQDDGGRAP